MIRRGPDGGLEGGRRPSVGGKLTITPSSLSIMAGEDQATSGSQ